MSRALVLLVAAGCASDPGGPVDPGPAPEEHEHDARFVGLWAVEQPTHALYEVTYYDFAADGALADVLSEPPDCMGHLSEHCVTGSVANCVPTPEMGRCAGTITCVFGSSWHSRDAATLVIAGDCSDGAARDIVIELAADASSNSEWGGAGGTLITVGNDAGWSHDGWPWLFRKCPAGSDPATCVP